MKVLAVFAAILAMGASYPVVKTWTLSELSEAIETKSEPTLMPYLEDALNQIMFALFTNKKFALAVIPSPSGASTWTVAEVTSAVEDPDKNQKYKFAIRQAYDILKQRNATGELLDTIEVVIPALDISLWSSTDVIEALSSPSTKAELIPYLEKAHSELKQSLDDGDVKEIVGMVTPVGLIPPKADYQYIPKPSKRLIKKTKKGL